MAYSRASRSSRSGERRRFSSSGWSEASAEGSHWVHGEHGGCEVLDGGEPRWGRCVLGLSPVRGAAERAGDQQKSKLELPTKVELDETLGSERVVAVLSDEPVTAQQVEAALKADPQNPKLPGVRFVTTEFVKVAP